MASVDEEPLITESKMTLYLSSFKMSTGCVLTSIGVMFAVILSLYTIFSVESLYTQIKLTKISENTDEIASTAQDLSQNIDVKIHDELMKILNARDKKVVWPMFDCCRTNTMMSRGIVTYDLCLVDTTNGTMNKSSGKFTAGADQEGIYQVTFTAKYVANRNGRFGAWSDVYINDKVIADSQREYNGNSRTESSTHSVLAYVTLRQKDTLHVQFNKDGGSYMHSDNDHDVHFTARKVSDIP